MAETKFKQGDRVVVTGDEFGSMHGIDAGSEAVVLLFDEENEYLVSVQHTSEQALAIDWADPETEWENLWVECEVEWVREEDLLLNAQAEDKIWLAPIGSEGPFVDMSQFFSSVEPTALADLPYDEIEDDIVNNPPHYSEGMPEGVEVIDIIRAQGLLRDFSHGNAIKYLLRAKYKNGVEDLRKARVYLDWLIESWEDDGDG